ncbi:MAG: hypothetical protein JXX28_11130 [Deltaproteobacteria bacterium]|nr:hypothetical protein [Deltaproteobacteria bacterium]
MTLLLTAVLLTGCGIDPARIPAHHPFAQEGGAVQARASLSFAVVGSTRSLHEQGETELIADLRAEAPMRDLALVVLTGGYVGRSTTGEWRALAGRWSDVIDSELGSNNRARRPVAALVGHAERAGDRGLEGFASSFPDMAQEIGHNRNASWYHFDVATQGTTWRLLFLDSDREALGSRWNEQLYWLPGALRGGGYDRLIVFLPQPWQTLALGAEADPGRGPSELLEIVDENTDLMKLVAVVQGGVASNELHLPTGPYGELSLVAGNGSVPARTLQRWGHTSGVGAQPLSLVPGFDLALLSALDRWDEAQPLGGGVLDAAKGRGSWEGFTAQIDGAAVPVRGWWTVTLDGDTASVGFRMREPAGYRDLYTLGWTPSGGWK